MNAALHIGEPWWAAFIGFVLVMLAVELFLVGGNRARRCSSCSS
jgi:tellurite resistance protein TerC